MLYAKVPNSSLIVSHENFADAGSRVVKLAKGRRYAFDMPKKLPSGAVEVDIANVAQQMRDIVDLMDKNFVDRREYIELVMLAYASGQNLLTYGVPGTAKTAINKVMMSFFTGESFDYSLTNDTSDSDIFGPKSAKEYRENDRWIRNVVGSLVPAKKIFLDEIGKTTKRVYSMLMGGLESWFIRDGSQDLTLAGHVAIAASNEDLSAAMEGLDRRFTLRYEMPEITDPEKMKRVIMSAGDMMIVPQDMIVDIRHCELMAGVAEVLAKYKIDESVTDFYLEVWQEVESAGFHVDNSTTAKSMLLVVAESIWRGEPLSNKHVAVVANIFWRLRKDCEAVRQIVFAKTDPDKAALIELRKLFSDTVKRFEALENDPNRGNNPEYNQAITDFRLTATEVMSDIDDAIAELQSAEASDEASDMVRKLADIKDNASMLATRRR